MNDELVAEFWKRVVVGEPDECWEWIGYRMPPLRGKGPHRYGKLNRGGEYHYAHRLSFQIATGIKPSRHVLHSCDNMGCVNPRHLREGDNIDNVRDREDRGRSGDRRGEGNNCAKLTEQDVKEMRRLFAGGTSSLRLARMFSVSRATAYAAAAGTSWRHVAMPVHSGQTGEEIVVRTFGA